MDAEIVLDNLISEKIPKYIEMHTELNCTICNKNNINSNIGIYASDVNINEQMRKDITIDVIFCDQCHPEHIRLPHLGINEINLSIQNLETKEIRINHQSYDNQGIVWNPCKVWETITRYPCEQILPTPSAGYVSEMLYQSGIPIGDIIENDGKLNLKNYSRDEFKNRYDSYID